MSREHIVKKRCPSEVSLEEFSQNLHEVLCEAEVDEPAGRGCGYRISVQDDNVKFLYELAVELQNKQINQQEESNMSNVNNANRRIVKIQVIDNDPALDVDKSVVFVKEGVVTEDSEEVTIREWLSTGEIVAVLKKHNEVRLDTVNRDILNRTGNKVYLEAVKVKNLTITAR